MITPTQTALENLTLSDADLAACKPVAGEGGHVLRALCPFHGSDHQRSLRVTVATGRFVCFACGAWGYLAEARERWQEERQRQAAFWRPAARPHRGEDLDEAARLLELHAVHRHDDIPRPNPVLLGGTAGTHRVVDHHARFRLRC